MFSLSVRNERGETLSLTENKNYTVTKITGLTAAGCTINTSAVAGQDGERFHSSRINKRNIVITVLPEYPVDQNRINLYRFFSGKGTVRLFYKNRFRDVYIDGYVETLEGDLFSMREEIQISVLCPDPFFVKRGEEAGKISFSPIIPLTEFPYSPPMEGICMSEILKENMEFYNSGTVSTGGLFHVTPHIKMEEFCIYSQQGGYIGVKYPIKPYDNLYFNTGKGEKGIWLLRDDTRYNLLNDRIQGSTWPEITPGMNKFNINTNEFGYTIDITWKELYEGV